MCADTEMEKMNKYGAFETCRNISSLIGLGLSGAYLHIYIIYVCV